MDDDTPMIPKYWAESTVMHMSHANKRLLVALLAVCITFILTIVIFVHGYTVREKNWLDTLTNLRATEVDNGLYQQPDEGPYQ